MQQHIPLLLVLCEKRHLETIVQEFEDWKQEGRALAIVCYGITQKANDGFLLLEVQPPLPEGVYTNLVLDEGIVDYVLLNMTSSAPSPHP